MVKHPKLQLENEPMSQDRVADYDRAPQGTKYRLVSAFASWLHSCKVFSKICKAPKSMSMTIFLVKMITCTQVLTW
jgi:hypothetical protein